MTPTSESVDAVTVAELLRASAGTGLVCHVNPDGDALGSLLALLLALDRAGMPAFASFPAPFTLADALRVLPGVDRLRDPHDRPDAFDVLVTFDCAGPNRLHEFVPVLHRSRVVVVIDHHATNSAYGTHDLVDPDAPCTGVLVQDVIAALGVPLDADIATCLYAAIVADTDRFLFRSADASVLRRAADLVDAGARTDEVNTAMFENVPLAQLRLQGVVTSRAVHDEALGLVWSSVGAPDLAAAGVRYAATDALIEEMRKAAEAEVVCLSCDLPAGGVKVSLRSRGRIDAAAIALDVGGGGHRRAAGFRAASHDDALSVVRAGVAAQLAAPDAEGEVPGGPTS